MRKLLLLGCLLLCISIGALSVQPARADRGASKPADVSGSDLVDAVNALRAAQGLTGYRINPILMNIAQAHAEYMASIGVSTVHTDAQGRRPFQRALDAGYLVAGDLSLGGFYSENVTGGIGLTPEGAVTEWLGDTLHKNTMLSTVLQDVGGGVAVVGDTYYYCLDAGLSTGGTPVAYTPPAIASPTQVVVVNTPNADGSITYTIQPGDTIGAIALAYGISEETIFNLNNLTATTTIYPGRKLLLQAAFTPTATQPTPTASPFPTPTPWPTATYTNTPLPPTPTSTPSPNFPLSAAGGSVLAIGLVALLAAGVIAWVSARKRS
jgi:LysM repeat protein